MIMSLLDNLLPSGNSGYSESNGYYERVPIRVGEFVLVENKEGSVSFETTCRDFCDDGPKIEVKINKDDDKWGVKANQGGYQWNITPHQHVLNEKLSRRRAFWHALQYMIDEDLTYRERYSIRYQVEEDNPDIFKADAFFINGDSRTSDPFGDYLEK